jgi:hypothetical protein
LYKSGTIKHKDVKYGRNRIPQHLDTCVMFNKSKRKCETYWEKFREPVSVLRERKKKTNRYKPKRPVHNPTGYNYYRLR